MQKTGRLDSNSELEKKRQILLVLTQRNAADFGKKVASLTHVRGFLSEEFCVCVCARVCAHTHACVFADEGCSYTSIKQKTNKKKKLMPVEKNESI